jgi:hypothetical protein
MSLIRRVVAGAVVLIGLASQVSAQVVFNEVLLRRSGPDAHRDQAVELKNQGSSTVSIGGWILCHQASVSSVIPGGVSIPAGGLFVVHFRQSGTNSATEVFFPNDMLADVSDLGLYAAGSDFQDPGNLRAFIQFGGDYAAGRQAVAEAAGLWTSHSFIPSVPVDHSFELCGVSADAPSAYVDQASPTIGQANSCGVLVEPATWGKVKSMFH